MQYKSYKSCSSCEYGLIQTMLSGKCLRHAPTHKGFPIINTGEWCGDYRFSEQKSIEHDKRYNSQQEGK